MRSMLGRMIVKLSYFFSVSSIFLLLELEIEEHVGRIVLA